MPDHVELGALELSQAVVLVCEFLHAIFAEQPLAGLVGFDDAFGGHGLAYGHQQDIVGASTGAPGRAPNALLERCEVFNEAHTAACMVRDGISRWPIMTEVTPENEPGFELQAEGRAAVLRLVSQDSTNRLTIARVQALTSAVEELARQPPTRLIITGNAHFFSAGADLNEIAALTGPQALRFARMGQRLMNAVAGFPAPVFAAIHGYCMGGGLDLALACHRRIVGSHAIFGHRGAALGLVTGWGGTQRLPRLVGKARALQMFLAAEKVDARRAVQIGLAEALVDDPLAAALEGLGTRD